MQLADKLPVERNQSTYNRSRQDRINIYGEKTQRDNKADDVGLALSYNQICVPYRLWTPQTLLSNAGKLSTFIGECLRVKGDI